MTDALTTPRSRKHYPARFSLQVTQQMRDDVLAVAVRNELSQGEVLRTFIQAGIEAGEAERAADRAASIV